MLLFTIDVVNNNIAGTAEISMSGRITGMAAAKRRPGRPVSSRTSATLASAAHIVPPSEALPSPADVDLDVLNQHLGYLVRRFQVWIFQDFIQALNSIDVRPAQYSVLVVIGANPGLSQSGVADTLGIERARLVHLLDRLEKRDLVQRLPSPRDRRSHALQLTSAGQRLLKRAKALAATHEGRLAEKLGNEPRQAMLAYLQAFAR
jgi:DNA-binding MarR family transcriptional regulator